LHDKLGGCWRGNLHRVGNDTGGERKSRLDYDQLARSFHGNVESDADESEPDSDPAFNLEPDCNVGPHYQRGAHTYRLDPGR
jgi:hypothetical protein